MFRPTAADCVGSPVCVQDAPYEHSDKLANRFMTVGWYVAGAAAAAVFANFLDNLASRSRAA